MNPSHNPWEVAEAVLGVSRRVLLRGLPGTGKTYMASKAALKKGQKALQITMTEETPMAELRGHFIAKGGDHVWHDGPAIVAWKTGERLVINEIDRAGEDVHSFLFAIMDDPEFAELTLPTGEIVRPHENFQFVATMNGVPDDLPDALQDRLPVDIEITDLHPGALERLPEDLRGPAQNTALAKSEERAISVRMWMEFASLREKLDGKTGTMLAAHAVFGSKAEAAMLALKINEDISPAIDADGTVWPDELLRMIKTWLGVQHAGGDMKGIAHRMTQLKQKFEAALETYEIPENVFKLTYVSAPSQEELENNEFWICVNDRKFTLDDFKT